jgi:predicted metal-dependent hydrolase
MESINVTIEGIEILMEKSKKAGKISISVRPVRGVRVAVPLAASFRTAEKFAQSKIHWIKKSLSKIKKIEESHNSSPELTKPLNRKKSRSILISRLNQLAERYGFLFNRVFIRNQKTRWGSCSSNNNINLNINLVRLPGELMDYVILHELVHTRIKNHSRSFWRELDLYIGNSKKTDALLKKYSLSILRHNPQESSEL